MRITSVTVTTAKRNRLPAVLNQSSNQDTVLGAATSDPIRNPVKAKMSTHDSSRTSVPRSFTRTRPVHDIASAIAHADVVRPGPSST